MATVRLRQRVAQRGWKFALGTAWAKVRRSLLARHLDDAGERALRSAGTHPFDKATGLDTAGLIHGRQLATGHPHDVFSASYYGSAPSLVRAVLQRWRETPGAAAVERCSFLDVGSGKGRAVLVAAEWPFRQCLGVELNPHLAEVAAQNMLRWQAAGRAQSPMRSLCQEATAFAFPDGPCLLYLFHPFTGQVLGKLLERIAEAFAGRPGQLDLVYVNAQCAGLLRQHAGFTLLWELPVRMSDEDAAADLLYLADASGKEAYGPAAEAVCSGWRWVGLPG